MLPDGTYEGLIVDAAPSEEPGGNVFSVEFAVSSGPHKGDVVAVKGHFPGLSDLDLLAAPGTLEVADGEPSLTLD